MLWHGWYGLLGKTMMMSSMLHACAGLSLTQRVVPANCKLLF
jgi:hypothetical protein